VSLQLGKKLKKKINEENCGVVSTLESDVKTLQASKIPANKQGKDLNPTIKKYCHLIKKADGKADSNTSTTTAQNNTTNGKQKDNDSEDEVKLKKDLIDYLRKNLDAVREFYSDKTIPYPITPVNPIVTTDSCLTAINAIIDADDKTPAQKASGVITVLKGDKCSDKGCKNDAEAKAAIEKLLSQDIKNNQTSRDSLKTTINQCKSSTQDDNVPEWIKNLINKLKKLCKKATTNEQRRTILADAVVQIKKHTSLTESEINTLLAKLKDCKDKTDGGESVIPVIIKDLIDNQNCDEKNILDKVKEMLKQQGKTINKEELERLISDYKKKNEDNGNNGTGSGSSPGTSGGTTTQSDNNKGKSTLIKKKKYKFIPRT